MSPLTELTLIVQLRCEMQAAFQGCHQQQSDDNFHHFQTTLYIRLNAHPSSFKFIVCNCILMIILRTILHDCIELKLNENSK